VSGSRSAAGYFIEHDIAPPRERTPPLETSELGAPERTSRRRLLQFGAAGAAIAATIPALTRQVSAAPVATSAGGPPPKRPTPADIELLVFAESVELAARDLYDVAAAAASGQTRDVMAVIGQHHQAYAEAIAGLLGPEAGRRRNEAVFEALSGSFGNSASQIGAAYELEDTAVATHTELLGALEGTEGAALVSSILIVEAQHATVLAGLDGRDDLDVLLSTQGEALTPSEATDTGEATDEPATDEPATDDTASTTE
jgi:rubrerythrin